MGSLAKSILAKVRQDGAAPGANLVTKTILTPGVATTTTKAPGARRAATTRPMSPATSKALKAVGTAVKKARQARRLTQEELAKRAGIARKTLVNMEAGAGSPAMATFFEVLAVLDEDVLNAIVSTLRADPTAKRLLEARMPEAVVRRKKAR